MTSDGWLSARIRQSEAPDAVMMRNPPADLILFGGGLPDPVTHPVHDIGEAIAGILEQNEPSVLGYGAAPGDLGLRQLIAARAGREGATLTADNIVLTNGSSGAIGLSALALLDPDDVVVVESLTYPGAIKAFRQMGAAIEVAPMDGQGLDPDGLASLLARVRSEGRRVKAIYTIATCHNPTGAVLDLERRRAVIRLAERAAAMVIQDDTYGDIRFEAGMPPPFIALAPERTVHLGSFSKTIAPGLRVGWAAASPQICAAFARARVDLGNGMAAQRAVASFIADGRFEAHVRTATDLYRRKRDLMLAALDHHCAGLAEWRRPDGGFFVWMRLLRGEVAGAGEAALAEKVAFLPGPYFSAGAPHTRHLRLSYGQIPEGRIEEGVARLSRALAANAAAAT